MDEKKKAQLLRDIAASNPLAAAMIADAAATMKNMMETLAGDSDVIEVNGVTLKRGPNGFGPLRKDEIN